MRWKFLQNSVYTPTVHVWKSGSGEVRPGFDLYAKYFNKKKKEMYRNELLPHFFSSTLPNLY
jgi:hypothetical protein